MRQGKPRQPSRARAAGPIVLTVALVVAVACGKRQSESIQPRLGEQAFGEVVPVETLKLRRQDFVESFPAPGLIAAREEVTISAEVAARVVAIGADVGDEVQAGHTLARLDRSQIEARIRKVEAQISRTQTQLAQALKDLERQEQLFKTDVASESSVDEARLRAQTLKEELAAEEAELSVARVDLERTTIGAPIAGSIAERHVSAGEYVTPGTRLFDLVMLEKVKFLFRLAEADVTRVAVGQRLDIQVDAYPGRTFEGRVRAVAPAGNAATRTFRVELEIDNPAPHPLLPGMSGKAEVVRARYEQVFLLPEEAILREADRNYIYVANDAHARPVDVRILSAAGARAVIAGELGEDFDCIILGQYAVRPGAPIHVRRAHETMPEVAFD